MSDEAKIGDLVFSQVVRVLAQALVPVAADLRKLYEDGATSYLIEYLRSEKPILSADRDNLADLLEGIASRPPGRPENRAIKSRRRAIERDYHAIRQHGGTPEQAWQFLAAREMDEFGDEAFSEYGFKPRAGDLDDLAKQLAEWSRRPQSRK